MPSPTDTNASGSYFQGQPSLLIRLGWAVTSLTFFTSIFVMYFSTLKLLMSKWQFGSYRHLLHGFFGF